MDIIESFLKIRDQIHISMWRFQYKFVKLLSSSRYQIFSKFISYAKSLSMY